jgi:hypothetical protein
VPITDWGNKDLKIGTIKQIINIYLSYRKIILDIKIKIAVFVIFWIPAKNMRE